MLFGLNFEKVKMQLHHNLFRVLCNYNLTGNVSFQQLKEVAMGYSIQRTVTQNRVIENLQVQYNEIDMHVMLCMMTMQRLHLTKKFNYDMLTMINKLPLLKHVLVSTLSFTSLKLLNTILEVIVSIMGQNVVDIIFNGLQHMT